MEKILINDFLASKLSKGDNGTSSVVYSVDKDSNYYCIQDTVDKVPSNIQMLENVDLGKSDGIKFKEYLENMTGAFVINFGDFETNYPVPVFLDSIAIYSNPKIGARATLFLNGIRKIIKEAKDSIGLDLLKEVNNPNEARIRLDYTSSSHVIPHYSKDENGNWNIDSSRVYVDPFLANSLETLMIEGRHELIGHMHTPNHSKYGEDITSTNTYSGKTYSKADKLALRALALTKPGTYWKKFVKR